MEGTSGGSHNKEKLEEHIVSLSVADTFEEAKVEWSLFYTVLVEEWDTCPCGKEIKELCYIKNMLNDKITYVGNICIKNFMQIDTGNLFQGLKRILEDPNEDLIEYAKEFECITPWEYGFLLDTKRKRKLSWKQMICRKRISAKIIKKMIR
jgi:GTP cyclohydrolase FolE2